MNLLELPLVPQSLEYTCGAACFESMYRFLKGESPGELHFAKALGNLELGYTPPQHIVLLAEKLGLTVSLKEGAFLNELRSNLKEGKVIFVTWWDEDAGHYSLIRSLSEKEVELMDPLTAREGRSNYIPLEYFLSYWELRGRKMISVSA